MRVFETKNTVIWGRMHTLILKYLIISLLILPQRPLSSCLSGCLNVNWRLLSYLRGLCTRCPVCILCIMYSLFIYKVDTWICVGNLFFENSSVEKYFYQTKGKLLF